MSEKSFQDLAHDDEHLAEKKISGEGVYDGMRAKRKPLFGTTQPITGHPEERRVKYDAHC